MAQLHSHGFDYFRPLYLFQKHREGSFVYWPFNKHSQCNRLKMSEAGFYWSGDKQNYNQATCFVCKTTILDWESSNNPWAMHARYAPNCAFVKYGKKEADLVVEEFLNIFKHILFSNAKQLLTVQREEFMKRAQVDIWALIMQQNK